MTQQDHEDQENPEPQFGPREIVRTALILAILVLAVAALSGRWDWWAGWAFLAVFIGYSLILFWWLSVIDPGLARERRSNPSEGVQPYERVIIPLMVALELALLIVAALDNGRFGWSEVPVWARGAGWTLLAITGAAVAWVLRTNTFAGGIGRIQDDRGHHVITAGPYRLVRHPMYAGIILCLLGLPPALGSWWALIPGGLLGALFILRTALEDRLLHKQLPGYPA